MGISEFTVFDVSRFPAVCCHAENMVCGYGRRWQEEMEALIAHGDPFYMIFLPGDFCEDKADTRLRALWLKANKTQLAMVCRSLISIEADPERRAALTAEKVGLERAFGIPRLVTSSLNEALLVGATSLCLEQNA